MRIATFITLLLAGVFSAQSALAGDVELKPKDYFTQQLLDNVPKARHYLQLEKGSSYSALESTALHKTADIDGDGVRDYVLAAFANKACVVAGFIKDPNGGLEDCKYVGYSPVDCDFRPTLTATDVMGDSAHELRVESLRTYKSGRIVKTLSVIGFNEKLNKVNKNEKMQRYFRTILDEVARDGIYRHRRTNLVKFEDTDEDGVKEILVTGREVETIQDKGKELEIEDSVVTSERVFAFESGRPSLIKVEVKSPTPLQRLNVAQVLADKGATARASIIAHSLIREGDLKDDAMVSARNLAGGSDAPAGNGNGGDVVVKKDQGDAGKEG